MKVRDDRVCSYCNDVVDYIEHFFFDCPTIKKFWNYIEQYNYSKSEATINLLGHHDYVYRPRSKLLRVE